MIEFCPHCCNRAKQELIHEQKYVGVAWATDDGEEDAMDGTYYVFKCTTCSEILVYHQIFQMELTLEFPDIRLDESVPAVVSKIYNEAIRIKRLSPNSFAVQIRRAMEAICADRGVKERTLAQGLKVLCERGEIPPSLSEATDILRLIGNMGAHLGDADVHPLQASAIDDFFNAVIDYIYVSPAKISSFKNMLKNYKGGA